MDILFSLINLSITIVVVILVLSLFVLVARKCSIITNIFFFCFISSMFLFLLTLLKNSKIEFYPGMSEYLVTLLSCLSSIYSFIKLLFLEVVVYLFSLFMDVTIILSIFNNGLFLIILNGVLFLLSALIFRKKNKNKIERSRYSD